jgi:MFS family permease
MAEIIGTLGTSGFLGTALGPMIGDAMFGAAAVTRGHLDGMFLTAAALGGASLLAAVTAMRGHAAPVRRKRMPIPWLVQRYHPGALMLVGVALGIGVGLPATFLRTFTADLGIPKIQLYFLTYTVTAFLARLATRRLTERLGIRRVVLLGMLLLIAGMMSFVFVSSYALLVVPAAIAGAAHAVLFPSVMAGGGLAFPPRYRGLATTLMLATLDLGVLLGGPLVGGLLRWAQWMNLPRYPTMFAAVTCLLAAAGTAYACERRKP